MPGSKQYTAEMAADPKLSRADMQEIAGSRLDLLPVLASNPSLYPALAEWLAGHPDPAVQEAVAARGVQKIADSAALESGQLDAGVDVALNNEESVGEADWPLEESAEHTKSRTARAKLTGSARPPSLTGPTEDQAKDGKRKRRIVLPAMVIVLVLGACGVYWFSREKAPELVVPEDALDISEFASPYGNLQCEFMKNAADQNYIKCTTMAYEFVPDVECDQPDDPMTYELYDDGTVNKRCTAIDIVEDKPRLQYGMAVAQNGFACTLEENIGFTCWSEKSGKGFQIGTFWNRTF